jgi:hypothetical protein
MLRETELSGTGTGVVKEKLVPLEKTGNLTIQKGTSASSNSGDIASVKENEEGELDFL